MTDPSCRYDCLDFLGLLILSDCIVDRCGLLIQMELYGLSVCLSVSLSVRLSVCLSVCHSVRCPRPFTHFQLTDLDETWHLGPTLAQARCFEVSVTGAP